MNVLILGGDGYLGWPTAMSFAAAGHDVTVADNYMRRHIAEETDSEGLFTTPTLRQRISRFKELTGKNINVEITDLSLSENMFSVVKYSHLACCPRPDRPYNSAHETVMSREEVAHFLSSRGVI